MCLSRLAPASNAHILFYVARVFARVLAIVACLSTWACAEHVVREPQAAPPAPEPGHQTEALPTPQNQPVPKLIAPPPAYGNKIVMARLRTDARFQ